MARMIPLSSFILALLIGSTAAKICQNITVPVDISARTGIFDLPIPQSNSDATAFIQNLTQQGRNFTDVALTGYQTTAGRYQISTQFCVPSENAVSNPTLQILTHGIGFDKTYWDLSYNDFNYSYINTAVDTYKYSTLSYDRLGIGASSHGEPLNEIQSFLEVAALAELTTMLRAGTFPAITTAFKKIVHVGHSFGSAQSYSLVNQYPDISDGIVLTGFSMNSSFTGYFQAGANFVLANLNQPFRFGNASFTTGDAILSSILSTLNISSPSPTSPSPQLTSLITAYGLTDLLAGLSTRQKITYPNGYLTNSNAASAQFLFLLPGHFDPAIGAVGETGKQPVTLGELLTLGSLPMQNSFRGPVMVFTGENDLPFCGANCLATDRPDLPSIPAAVAESFPFVGAGNFMAYIQPDTGHGLNLHYNQTAGYRVINEWLGARGLGGG